MRRPIDVATMFGVLWLLGSMVIDVLTPKELTVYMIAAATAPTVVAIGLCYYLRFPMIDFAMISATFWLVAALAIEWISPKPLPAYIIGGALVPVLIVGAVLHWRRYRSGESWRTSVYYQSARRSTPGLPPCTATPRRKIRHRRAQTPPPDRDTPTATATGQMKPWRTLPETGEIAAQAEAL